MCVCVCVCVCDMCERKKGENVWDGGMVWSRVCYVGDSIQVDLETNTGCAATHKDSPSYNMLFPRLTCRHVQYSCCSQS